MPRAKVVRINQSLYLNVPADDARRLHLREGQVVDFEVKPVGETLAKIVGDLGVGPARRARKPLSDRELWGDGWG